MLWGRCLKHMWNLLAASSSMTSHGAPELIKECLHYKSSDLNCLKEDVQANQKHGNTTQRVVPFSGKWGYIRKAKAMFTLSVQIWFEIIDCSHCVSQLFRYELCVLWQWHGVRHKLQQQPCGGVCNTDAVSFTTLQCVATMVTCLHFTWHEKVTETMQNPIRVARLTRISRNGSMTEFQSDMLKNRIRVDSLNLI